MLCFFSVSSISELCDVSFAAVFFSVLTGGPQHCLRKELYWGKTKNRSRAHGTVSLCVCVLQRKKRQKVSVKLCVLYLRVWLSYVCQPAQQSERNGRLKEYRHTMWVCVFLKHKLACVISVARADREESVTEIFVLLQWNLCYFSHWYPDRTTTVFCRATAFVIKFDRKGICYSICQTAAKTLN